MENLDDSKNANLLKSMYILGNTIKQESILDSLEEKKMRRRTILVIHEVKLVKTFLKNYIFSELDDAQIVEASSVDEGLEKIQERKFDIVICGNDNERFYGKEIFENMRSYGKNKETEIILILMDQNQEKIDEFKEIGIEHCLVAPFTSQDLGTKINEICNPKKWRTQDRVNIPGMAGIIHSEEQDIPMKIINLNTAGMLCDLPYPDNINIDLLQNTLCSLKFPSEYKSTNVRAISKLLRLNVLSWTTDDIPNQLRVVWKFTKMDDKDYTTLKENLSKAKTKLDLIQ